MSLKLIDAILLIGRIYDIATDTDQTTGAAEHALDAVHKLIEEFSEQR